MEKRGDIVPGITPPEAIACKKRVEDFKQRMFSFVEKMSGTRTHEDQIKSLDSDFRKVAADKAAAEIR